MNLSNRRVVVPLDGSRASENALAMAAVLAPVFDAAIDVIHVVGDSTEASNLTTEGAAFAGQGETLAREYHLDEGRCSFRVVAGSAPDEILEAASGAVAIVLASHGRGGFRATFFGSVADKVVRRAPVPVLVVPGVGGPPRSPRTILVALDGSDIAERGLGPARRIGARLQAKLVLMRAYLPAELGYRERMIYPAGIAEAAAQEARDYLEKVKLPGEDVRAVEADAAGAVLSASATLDADLVVMGAAGKGLAGRLVLGSTTDRVLHSLHRPLLIVSNPPS